MADVPATFYTGLVADLYARLKSTTFEADPYRDLIHRYGEPALELGCGDGDPLLDLRAMGLDVDGIDSSADMIERLLRRAAAQDLRVDARVARMETLRTHRSYRTVFLAGPTFNLLPDDQAMQQALHAIRRALSTDGTAVIPLFVPEPVSIDDLGLLSHENTPEGRISCEIVEAERDERLRTQTLTLRYERAGDGGIETLDRDWLLHWIDLDRFTDLACSAGLSVVSAPPIIGTEPVDIVLEPN